MKKRPVSKELAKWLFQQMYWLDKQRIPKKRWKDTIKRNYVESGISKKFKKGTFKGTWRFIRKEGLIREGRRCKTRRHRIKKEE